MGQDIFKNTSVSVDNGNFKFGKNFEKPACVKNLYTENDVKCTDDKLSKMQLLDIINEYRDVFASDLNEIGKTNAINMDIKLDTDIPIAQSPYRIPEPKKRS